MLSKRVKKEEVKSVNYFKKKRETFKKKKERGREKRRKRGSKKEGRNLKDASKRQIN